MPHVREEEEKAVDVDGNLKRDRVISGPARLYTPLGPPSDPYRYMSQVGCRRGGSSLPTHNKYELPIYGHVAGVYLSVFKFGRLQRYR